MNPHVLTVGSELVALKGRPIVRLYADGQTVSRECFLQFGDDALGRRAPDGEDLRVATVVIHDDQEQLVSGVYWAVKVHRY